MIRIFPFKFYIDLKSFFRKGFKVKDSIYGVYTIVGFQGSGKTMFAVDFLLKNYIKGKKIYTNIDSLKLEHEYINKVSDLNPSWRDCFVVIDEVHKAFPKNSKTDKAFYSFLQESRKHHRVCILITQEFKEIPMWLRRPMKLLIGNRRIFKNFIIEDIQDARTMAWDETQNDYVCETIQKNLKKWNKRIADFYDTNETIFFNEK